MAGFHKIRNTGGRTIYLKIRKIYKGIFLLKIHTKRVINNHIHVAYFIMYRMFNMLLYSFMYNSLKDSIIQTIYLLSLKIRVNCCLRLN